RTQKRDARGGAKGTQQLFRLDPAEPDPVPIEDTQLLRNFDAWVAHNIGLDYETFTASVLLLQGKAEKLLDSKPEGRREVRADIERAVTRLRELREVLPQMELIVGSRGEQGKATKLLEELERERLRRKELLIQKEDALKQAADKRKTIGGRGAEQETRLRET